MIIRPAGFFGKRYILESEGAVWWRLAWATTPTMIAAALALILILGMQPAADVGAILIGLMGFAAVHFFIGKAMLHATPEESSDTA